MQINIDLNSIVPKAYAPLYNDRTRYLTYKGSRGSRKSFSVAEDVIMQIILHPYVNWIVLRQYAYTNKDSTYSTIQQAAFRLGVYDLFKFTLSPLEITFKPTGQKVFFFVEWTSHWPLLHCSRQLACLLVHGGRKPMS